MKENKSENSNKSRHFNLNPFYCMGYNIDINDKNVQEKLIDYVENNSNVTLDGYSFNCINTYTNNGDGNLQFSIRRDDKELSLSQKIEDLVIHHTNNCIWRSEIDSQFDIDGTPDEYIIKPFCSNPSGSAFIRYINIDTMPYVKAGDCIFSQVNCFGYDVRVFHDDEIKERNKNNLISMRKKGEPIYLEDNSITSCAMLNPDGKCDFLNYVRGEIIDIETIEDSFWDEKTKYYIIILDTKFGPTPVTCCERVIKYNKTNTINIGDVVEAVVSTVGDIMITYGEGNAKRDKSNYFDLLCKCFEKKDMTFIEKSLSDDCEYHSNNHDVVGKEDVINKLKYITAEGYSNDKLKTYYAMITNKPLPNFKLYDEVICLEVTEENCEPYIEGEINIHVNKEHLIDRIFFTSDKDIKFAIYESDGSIGYDKKQASDILKLDKMLRNKKVAECDINAILLFAGDKSVIVKKIIQFVNKSDKNGHSLVSDILQEEHQLIEKFNETHQHKEQLRIDDMVNKEEYVPIKYAKKAKSYNTVEYNPKNETNKLYVVDSGFTSGSLRVLSDEKVNYALVHLELSYGPLNELDKNNRNSLKKITVEDADKYDYSFNDEVKNIKKDLKNYDEITFWIKEKNSNTFLIPFYFINKFYNELQNKEIKIIYIDSIKGRYDLSELLDGEFEKLVKKAKVLSKEDIDEYSNRWEEIKKVKCDIRSVKKGEIEYYNFEDFFDVVLKTLSKYNKIDRTDFIWKLMKKDLIIGVYPEIYNHIIDMLINLGKIKSEDYKMGQSLPRDIISINNNESIK